jgi:hypothetical protein
VCSGVSEQKDEESGSDEFHDQMIRVLDRVKYGPGDLNEFYLFLLKKRVRNWTRTFYAGKIAHP